VDHLDEIPVEELQDALDNVDGKKPTQRLLAAIAYKNGVTQTELAEWYDVQRRSIYNWLKRLDTDESLEHAVSDDKRTGRKRKLSESQQENSKKPFTIHLKRSGSTRRRGRRRLPERISKKRTALRIQSRVAGGC